MTLSLSAAAVYVCVCAGAFKVKSKDGDNGWMPIKDAAGWIAETLLYRFLFPKNNFFFSFPFFSFLPSLLSFVRNIVNAIKPSYPFVCVTRCGSCVCVYIRWLPIVPLNAIPQSTLTVYRSVDSAHTQPHTPYFLLYNFTKVGRERKRGEGGETERKRILVTIKSSPICI